MRTKRTIHSRTARSVARTRWVGAVTVSALALAACGGDDATATSVAPAVTAAATAAAAAADETAATAATTAATDTGDTAAAGDTTAAAAVEGDATPAIVAAANAFLDSLTEEERTAVLFDFSDTEQRQQWSNLPEGLYERDGVMWGNLDEDSQQAWLGVLQAILSDDGYTQVMGEWQADQALLETDGGGGNLMYGEDYYWVAIIGQPSETDPWQFQFGGHHVTVNATIQGSNVSVTPSFIGVQPATFDADGNEVRPLGAIESDAYALVASLDSEQQSAAVLGGTLIDLVVGPGEDGRTIESQGVAGADLTAEQQQLLLTLIEHYGGLVNDEDAAVRMAQLTAEIGDTYFAWYGPTDPADTSGIYFRVTGPSIVIEYSGQSMGGSSTDHIHGIYRDPTNDYGAAFGAGLS